jgi:hypothetical protein
MPTDNYTTFTSTDPKLDFTFLYPSAWQTTEFKEKEYSQVLVRGPRNKEDTYSTAFVITVASAATMNLDDKVSDYLGRASKAREFKLISQARGTLALAEAAELLTSYKMGMPLHSVHPTDTTIMERRIILKKDGQFYELGYRTVEGEYHAYLHAFEHAVRTFEFVSAEVQVFRPLVTSAPELALAERQAEYTVKK